MFVLIVIYLTLFILHRKNISDIPNPVKTIGEISGTEILVGKGLRKIKNIVSFYVDNEMFVTNKFSSPVFNKKKYNGETKYEVIYDKNNPNRNIVVTDDIFIALRNVMYVIIAFYIVVITLSINIG